MTCPKSYVTGDSMAWLERFESWRRGERGDRLALEAREVEAMMLLERELAGEMKRADE